MTMRMVPLRMSLIEQGDFLGQADVLLAEIQQAALEYAKEHGDKAKNSKTKMTLEITLQCQDPKSLHFSIATQLKTSLPSPPASVSHAMGSDTQDEKLALWVQATGSSENQNEQGKRVVRYRVHTPGVGGSNPPPAILIESSTKGGSPMK